MPAASWPMAVHLEGGGIGGPAAGGGVGGQGAGLNQLFSLG